MRLQITNRKLQIALALAMSISVTAPAQQLAASHAPTQIASQAFPAADKPVARVNGVVLTNRDLLREEYAIFPYARQHNGEIPKELEPGIRAGAMQMIIFEELVYQEALRRKMAITSAKMQNAERDFHKQFSTPEEYQHFLQAEFQGSRELLRARLRRSLLIDALLKAEVEAKSTVSLAELQAYYAKNPARFKYPESFAIQTISFIPPDQATPQQLQEARKRAEGALAQAKAAKSYDDFGLLAEKVSEDDYRVMMGDHKAVERSKLAPQVIQALLSMKPGEVTGIIQVEQVYTIVRLNQHIPAGKRKFEEVKTELRKELEKEKTNQVRAAFHKKLARGAKIEFL